MNKCKGIFGLIFGHKFVHNYNTEESFPDRPIKLDGAVYPEDLVNSFKQTKETYVNSVCSRCGSCVRTSIYEDDRTTKTREAST